MGKAVRMADIAERLNISVESVSKALAGKRGVSEEMRAKVVALAKELGYESSKVSKEHSGNIAVLISDRFFSGNGFYTNLFRFLTLKGSAAGFTFIMDIVSQETERNCVQPTLVADRKVEAIVFMGNFELTYLRTVLTCGLPFLFLDFHIPGYGKNSITSDNLDGGFQLTKHLLAQGWREIGFVGSTWATSSIMGRYMGYQWALQTENLTPKKEWLIDDRDENGALIPLDLPEKLPQAFLCSCDDVAYYLIEILQKRGLRVPEDIAVCGYDDVRSALPSRLPLTTYQVNVEGMAEATIKQLQQKFTEGQADAVSCIVPGHLVVRNSTEKPE